MRSTRFVLLSGAPLALVALLLLGLSPAVATAQSEVKGSGNNIYYHGAKHGGNGFQHIAVNAWLEDGVAHGIVTFEGDVGQPLPGGNTGYAGGPSNPWLIDVTDISFDGNTAFVFGVVVNSPNHALEEGITVFFSFTDNRGTGEPDEINGVPIDAGNIIVR